MQPHRLTELWACLNSLVALTLLCVLAAHRLKDVCRCTYWPRASAVRLLKPSGTQLYCHRASSVHVCCQWRRVLRVYGCVVWLGPDRTGLYGHGRELCLLVVCLSSKIDAACCWGVMHVHAHICRAVRVAGSIVLNWESGPSVT
jgi:hypothetical protein